jgi:uncharacterized membrane protein YedE/YeeE
MNRNIEQHINHGLFGLIMGVTLSCTGFTSFEEVHKMFTFADLRLLFVFAGAVGLTMVAFAILARGKNIGKKHFSKGTIPGSVMFGVGWAITGSCPSIALVQIGEGKLAALFTLFGILTGVWAYRRVAMGSLKLDTGVCGET